jgi:hypothetical protein
MLSGGMTVSFSLRLNILVQAEEVRRIVLILQSRQPIVVRPISCPHTLISLLTEIVDIHRFLQMGLHGLEERLCPSDVFLTRGRIFPLRLDGEVKLVSAGEGRLFLWARRGLPLRATAEDSTRSTAKACEP